MEQIVIIGNGIAGITAARHIRKMSDKRITIVSAETDYFFSRTALMYVYMGHMRWEDIKPYEDWFWKKNHLDLKKGYVQTVDTENKTLHFKEGETLSYDRLILATGSTTQSFGWEGLGLNGVQGLVTKQDLELLEKNAPNKEKCPHAVIVGGGLIGIEMAEMLKTRDINVTMLVREPAFWDNALPMPNSEMLSKHILSHGIDLRHHSQLDKIIGDDKGNVRAVLTTSGEEIPCRVVGIATGVKPNIDFLKESNIDTDRGILVNRQLQTNIPEVYAIGDCAQQREPIGKRPAIEAVWYTGRMMGETVAQTICGNPMEYNPGPWFNSAKFFDIEYQTYGWVLPRAIKKEEEYQFHWKCRSGLKAITVSYHRETGEFLGINTFGIRMKHQIFDKWLKERKPVKYVIEHLGEANFDPEFYRRYEKDIKTEFMAEKEKA